ncbi:MAG: hypothetical protein KF805_03695 [Phycisphaeraceae bacterium]|nr:hypothetical protein [Phycisphaeraceae bacterium]
MLLPVAWIASTIQGLFTPGRQLRRATIVERGSRPLLALNMLIASLLLTAQSAGTMSAAMISFWPVFAFPTPAVLLGPTWRPASYAIVFALWFTLFSALTRIERVGIHFYSRRRSWRIDPVLSLVGTAHASGAWIATALAARLLPLAFEALENALPGAISMHLVGIRLVAAPLGFIAGMIWFELATYFGLRACRYGNPPGVRLPDA